MVWRKERNVKEMSVQNAFSSLLDVDDWMGIDRQGRPVFMFCPTVDNLNQVFRDKMDMDVNFNDFDKTEGIKKSINEVQEHHNKQQNLCSGNDLVALYKEDVVRAGIFYLEKIMASIKACDSSSVGESRVKSVTAVRSAVVILDLKHYCKFAELTNNIGNLKCIGWSWSYLPKLLTFYTEGYELIKNYYPGLVDEIYLLNGIV